MTQLKTLFGLFIVLFLFSFNTQAQLNNFEKGTITTNKNKTIEAYIEIDYRFPQHFQASITYVSINDYDKYQQNGKLKGKSKKRLKPQNIVGFDLENGKIFRTVKYMDHGKLGTIGMTPKDLCLEKRVDGKINVYKLYSHTTGKTSQELASVIMNSKKDGDEVLIEYIQNNFQLLVQKDSDSPKNLMEVSLLNYIGDNKRVKENFTKNHYGFRDELTDDGTSIVNKKLEVNFLRLLEDYEGKVPSKLSK